MKPITFILGKKKFKIRDNRTGYIIEKPKEIYQYIINQKTKNGRTDNSLNIMSNKLLEYVKKRYPEEFEEHCSRCKRIMFECECSKSHTNNLTGMYKTTKKGNPDNLIDHGNSHYKRINFSLLNNIGDNNND